MMLAIALAAWALALLLVMQPTGATMETRTLARVGDFLDREAGRLAERLLDRLRGPTKADEVALLCAAMCAELRAGASPEAALIASTHGSSVAGRARTAALLGEPVAPALAADARATGSAGLAGIGACWKASAHTGAGLAQGLDRVADLARAERRVAADLAAETAAPKATARILGMLPLMGILLGELLGASPLQWLIGSPIGWICLVAGAIFFAAGYFWTHRIMRQALPRPAQGAR